MSLKEELGRILLKDRAMNIQAIQSKIDIDLNISELEKQLDGLVEERVLGKKVTLRDPNEGVVLRTFEDDRKLEIFKKSKNSIKNPDTGIKYSVPELDNVPIYFALDPLKKFPGLDPIKNYTLEQCFIWGCDIVSFSENLTSTQMTQYEKLSELINEVLNKCSFSPNSVFALPTGDGYFLIFIDSKTHNVFDFSYELSQALKSKLLQLPMRVGINHGEVYIITHENKTVNAIGHSLNKCARVMSFGEDGDILVSEDFYSNFIEKSDMENNFHYWKEDKDKHGHKYKLYSFTKDNVGNKKVP